MVSSGIGNRILGNALFDNIGLGIDLGPVGVTPNDPVDADTGANGLQNFPVLVAAAGGVEGTLHSRPNTTYLVQYFASPSCDIAGNGEGRQFFGSQTVTTDPEGTTALPFVPGGYGLGQYVTATATSSVTNDTSEFSECVQPTAPIRAWVAGGGGAGITPT